VRLHRHFRWELALLGITVIWGLTFVMVKDAVEETPPMLFVAVRFAVAAAVIGAVGGFRRLTRGDVLAGALVGMALFGGYSLQTIGTQYTTASNTGFITGLFVVFTPLFATALARRAPSAASVAGVGLATGGLILLAARRGIHFARGDLYILGTAASFAWHIVLLGRVAPGRSPAGLAAVQFVTVTVLAGLWSGAGERAAPALDGSVWAALVVTGVFASALAFWVQTAAQRVVPPTRTAIILTGEPVFAGVFGYALAGDRLAARGYAGAALIVAGILVAELLSPEREAA
jgi:drug/metabolite transporter (DMT)-like permease